jgi:catechol 2,3-dioxygenase-like lactoylglutathione lyase family enzyme
MASGIDHLVIAVPDPDAAADLLTDALGIAFSGGGRHENLGTFNRIAFLGDAYLELLGVSDAELALTWPVGAAGVEALKGGGGFATYALLENDLQASVAALQAGGSSIGGAVHGSRRRPGGDLVEWWAATPPRLGPELPPFLIQHAYRGEEWGPEAIAARRAFVHPIGSPVRLAALEIPVADPAAVAAACAAEVGMSFSGGRPALARVGPHRVQLVRGDPRGGGARIVLRADAPDRAFSLAGVLFAIEPAWAP